MSNPAVGMPCPVCKVPLLMSDRQGVEVDYCPQCRGVWLDRGELDKIVERSGPPARAPQLHPGDGRDLWNRGHDRDYPKRRKKSFIEELFD
ncbi:TFIIB-type zinc ribbon-containing protein [Flavisphingomonas formosensis]|uniref:TFIIB-type zinc ribbon-containing protein n=1 Tax=Flavisphingomonas formosensis TaxID=861534 RepID=UPI0012FAD597|nr:zf-TFIIB domain-containing protein [Sphingomonas formosensis]